MPDFYKRGAPVVWGLVACSLLTLAVSGCGKQSSETTAVEVAPDQPAAVAEQSLWPNVQSAVKKDPAIEAKITELLGKLSTEQKVGQLIQPELRVVTPADVTEYSLGSILNGGG